MSYADIHAGAHGHSQVKRRRNGEKDDLAPLAQPSNCDRPHRHSQQRQETQGRLDGERHREIEPHAVRMYLSQEEAGVEVRHDAHVGQPLEIRFGQQLPLRHCR